MKRAPLNPANIWAVSISAGTLDYRSVQDVLRDTLTLRRTRSMTLECGIHHANAGTGAMFLMDNSEDTVELTRHMKPVWTKCASL